MSFLANQGFSGSDMQLDPGGSGFYTEQFTQESVIRNFAKSFWKTQGYRLRRSVLSIFLSMLSNSYKAGESKNYLAKAM